MLHLDALHANRLLMIEERPFSRVTKTLFSEHSPLRPTMTYLPSPPPEGEAGDAGTWSGYDSAKLQKFREDVLLDFASLESSLIHIQLILSSNQRERERYAADKARILETAQAVRDNTVELRAQLAGAQQILERRKGYDVEAAKILDNKKLRSRDETRTDIEKLEQEIQDLQQESAEYEVTWVSRRQQFDDVVREGDAMLRLIKGIKDEPEREAGKDDQMDDAEDGTKAAASRQETPLPDGRSPRPAETGDATPLPESEEAGAATPQLNNKLLDLDDTTRTASRVSSPLMPALPERDDVEMNESTLAETKADDVKQEHAAVSSGAEDYDNDDHGPASGVATPSADVVMDEE